MSSTYKRPWSKGLISLREISPKIDHHPAVTKLDTSDNTTKNTKLASMRVKGTALLVLPWKDSQNVNDFSEICAENGSTSDSKIWSIKRDDLAWMSLKSVSMRDKSEVNQADLS